MGIAKRHRSPKAEAHWEEDSEVPDYSLLKERMFEVMGGGEGEGSDICTFNIY